MKIWSLIFALILSPYGLAQEAPPVLGGSWAATAGSTQAFHGRWSAETSLRNPNAARGSWNLLNEAGEVLLEGTWSAQKSGQDWEGTWTARPMTGQTFSGTWTADATDLNAKSLAEMLQRAATNEVSGSWQSGRNQGNWRLKGSPRQGRK